MIKLQPWRAAKALFGFSTTGTSKQVVVPKGVKNLALSVYAYGRDTLSAWYSRNIHLTQDRLQAYKEFDDMDSCFSPETLISLVNGTEVQIKDLVEKDPFWVYSYDHSSGKIVPGKAVAKKTRKNAELVQVELDNGEKIRCTPDHKWMLRDGSYCEAKDLIPGTSLMPLYRKISQKGIPGYEELKQPDDNKWHYTHRQFAQRPVPEGCTIVHHKDYNKFNNCPDNLQWMTKKDHVSLHTTTRSPKSKAKQVKSFLKHFEDPVWRAWYCEIIKQSRTPEVRAAIGRNSKKVYADPILGLLRIEQTRLGVKEYHSDPVRHAEHHQMCLDSRTPEVIEQIRQQDLKVWDDPATHAIRLEQVRTGIAQYHADPIKHEEHRQICLKNWKDPEWKKEMVQRLQEGRAASFARKRELGLPVRVNKPKILVLPEQHFDVAVNHKVVSVLPLKEREDCYDIDVETYHNFALTAGVFVHNSDINSSILDLYGEEATQFDSTTGKRIWIEAEDEEVENICNKLFERINADEQCFPIARETAKYGNSFSALIQEQRNDGTPGEIIQLLATPVYASSRIEDDQGRLIGFALCPIEQLGSTAGMQNPTDLTHGNPTDPPWAMVHWRLIGKERIESYGTSILWAARRPWRRLEMSESSLVLYRIKRSPDRFVFYIKGMAGMSPEDRQSTMRKVRQELRKKHIINKESGQVRSEMDPLTPDEDIIVDEESVKVERLAGSVQVNHVFDIEYLRKRFFGSVKVPADYFGFSDAKSGFLGDSPLSQQDVNFARVVKRLQHSTMQGFATVAQLNLCWVGIDPRAERAKFTVHMCPVSALDEKNMLELEKTRSETLNVLQQIGSSLGIDSDEWKAYLLQQSRIPTHLLRKSGKEKNDLLKGKIVVDSLSESKVKTITEKLEKNDELNKKFKKFITEGVWLKQYHLEGQDQEKDTKARAKFIESLTQVSLKGLFSASSGSNCFMSTANNSQFKTENLPLRVKDEKNKKLTESTAVVKWQSEKNQGKVKETKNLMTETISKLKKELAESRMQQESQEVMELDDLVEVSIDEEDNDEKDID